MCRASSKTKTHQNRFHCLLPAALCCFTKSIDGRRRRRCYIYSSSSPGLLLLLTLLCVFKAAPAKCEGEEIVFAKRRRDNLSDYMYPRMNVNSKNIPSSTLAAYATTDDSSSPCETFFFCVISLISFRRHMHANISILLETNIRVTQHSSSTCGACVLIFAELDGWMQSILVEK